VKHQSSDCFDERANSLVGPTILGYLYVKNMVNNGHSSKQGQYFVPVDDRLRNPTVPPILGTSEKSLLRSFGIQRSSAATWWELGGNLVGSRNTQAIKNEQA
jgi:hypothetical protein